MIHTSATLTCPHCQTNYLLEMPTNACRVFFHCENCGKDLSPKAGDCCVFCSYADRKCPPIQAEGGTGSCCQ